MSRPSGHGDKYEGATVIEPVRGYHTEPVACLDFASLYPSIMMAHNLCYSTLVPNWKVKHFSKDGEIEQTPNGDWFVTKKTKKGVLPMILEDLISARKQAKEQ